MTFNFLRIELASLQTQLLRFIPAIRHNSVTLNRLFNANAQSNTAVFASKLAPQGHH
jgi:hypothetical protein